MATEISNLPSDPAVPNQGMPPQLQENNIKMETTMYQNNMDAPKNNIPVADDKQMNNMISAVENASMQGLTRLSVDIPQQTHQVLQDPKTIPNYIPDNATPIDYIQNHITDEEIQNSLHLKQNKRTSIEFLIDELKIPIVLAILYYLFQSKSFKSFIFSKAPSLFNDKGVYSQNGYIYMSILFGGIFYGGVKMIKHFDA